MGRRTAAWLAWSLCAVCVLLVALTVLLDYATDDVPLPPDARLGLAFTVPPGLLSLTYLLVGALIASRLPTNAIGWIFCGVGLLHAVQRFAVAYADYAIVENFRGPWRGLCSLVLFVGRLSQPYPGSILDAAVPRWAPTVPALADSGLGGAVRSRVGRTRDCIHTGTVGAHSQLRHEPVRTGGGHRLGAHNIQRLGGLDSPSAWCCYCRVVLPRSSHSCSGYAAPTETNVSRLKWFLFAAMPATVGLILITLHLMVYYYSTTFLFHPVYVLSSWVVFNAALLWPAFALLAVPIFTYIAIVRYRPLRHRRGHKPHPRLRRLDRSVVGIYVVAVGGLGVLFQARGNLSISLLATGLVAVLFQPLRGRLQRDVNRLMYGERDDPYAVTSRLGRRLEAALAPESVLSTIAETVAQALKLPYAAILLKEGEGFRSAAAYGSPRGEPETLPLVYQREEIGRLVLSPRSPGESFSDADRRLLEDLARQAEVAVHAVRLTADLQRSRERLVATREEERRRLRRDLHDGLGAQLAGLNVQAGTLRRLIPQDPVSRRRAGGRAARGTPRRHLRHPAPRLRSQAPCPRRPGARGGATPARRTLRLER